MNEDFLQYIWRYELFIGDYYVNNQKIEILNVGSLNTDSGPDFFNAKVKMDGKIWVGNIEIHKKSSDWFVHKHEIDQAYNNVILHVVEKIDKPVYDTKGREIPQIELNFEHKLLENYTQLLNSTHKINCESQIEKINKFDLSLWLDTLLVERLERKSSDIRILLKNKTNDWEEVLYTLILRYFGLKINSEPFEMLARSLPLKYILKQKNSLTSIEAMLFGQAGFLHENPDDEYVKTLQKEYKFLKSKYNLEPIDKSNWKFMRIRPASFPTVRIAQVSVLLFKHNNIFADILEQKNIKDLYKLFDINPSKYWESHYKFGTESKNRNKKLGKQTITLIIINVVIPMLFVYGDERNIAKYKDRALNYLQEIEKENNSIIRYWNSIGVETKSAYETQAILELHNNYCQKNMCLKCRIGNKLIKI